MIRGFLDRPDCRLYYEVTGAGPAIVFAHGLGGNHLSWWQQVPHFRERYTCVTYSHRGFSPSTAPAGGPDPAEYGADLAALVDHVGAADVRIVAQSMGGWSAMEYALVHPDKVRAIVMASTGGTVARTDALFDPPDKLAAWTRETDATARDLMSRGIHVAGGERMAREQPALHYLYQAIDALSAGLDKMVVRERLMTALKRPADVLRTMNVPTLWLAGEEDIVYPPFLCDVLARLMPNGEVHHVMQAGHSVYFERPAAFNKLVDDFFERYH